MWCEVILAVREATTANKASKVKEAEKARTIV